jgi:predicted HAD superfamily Cof-like phosphohydrolase
MTAQEMAEKYQAHVNGWTRPRFRTVPLQTETAALRAVLIQEELTETVLAMRDGELVGVADGLADLKYVVLGTASVCGIDQLDDFMPHARELTKPTASYTLMFQTTALRHLVAVADALRLLTYDGFAAAAIDTLARELHSLSRLTSKTAADLGLPFKAIFAEVHRSNMTKTPATAAPGEKYGAGGGKGPNYEAPDIAAILEKTYGAPRQAAAV